MSDPLIVQVIRRYHPEWEPPRDTGREWHKCLCPWHGDGTASAGVSYSLNGFRCLGCGFGGSAVTIIKQIEGVSYSEAVKLAETISEGSYKPVSPRPNRLRRRRVLGEPRPVADQREGRKVPPWARE